MIGETVAHYRVTSKLGAGGMGEVFRATDSRLNREVALKLLPEHLANDKERMARFHREAQVLASLSHPHIAGIHGLEESGTRTALVMELVEGEDLSERLKRGAIPLVEALGIARQIAEALEAAHDKGVIHRDLKPANVKVTPEGEVKVLDFGLAKALEGSGTGPGTRFGRGGHPHRRLGDSRRDRHGHGGLHEPRAGERVGRSTSAPTSGRSAWCCSSCWPAAGCSRARRARTRWPTCCAPTSTGLGCRLRRPGRSASCSNAASNAIASAASRRSARRASSSRTTWPMRRPRAAAASRFRRSWRLHEASPRAVAGRGRGGRRAARRARAALASARRRRRSLALRADLRISDAPLFTDVGSSIELSPDGTRLVYVSGTTQTQQLYMRPLNQLDAAKLAEGNTGATSPYQPFFSPDGQWIGYVTASELRKVPVSGGTPLTLTKVTQQSRRQLVGGRHDHLRAQPRQRPVPRLGGRRRRAARDHARQGEEGGHAPLAAGAARRQGRDLHVPHPDHRGLRQRHDRGGDAGDRRAQGAPEGWLLRALRPLGSPGVRQQGGAVCRAVRPVDGSRSPARRRPWCRTSSGTPPKARRSSPSRRPAC